MIQESIHQFFVKHRLAPSRLVAAVSGGVDSTALLVALHESGFDVVAAHVNHHLRGAASDADEAFVRDLCARLGVPLHVADGTLDRDAVKARGIEAAAREVRYARLIAIREETGARYVATAHQKNDQAETVRMRMLTGGVLRGIQPVRDDGIIRPLLEVTRDELAAFLRERGIEARHDASNDDPRFLRNRVRTMLRGDTTLATLAGEAEQQWQQRERALDAIPVEVGDDETRFPEWPEDEALRQALLHRHLRRLDPGARPGRRTHASKQVELVRRGSVMVLRRRIVQTPPFEAALTPERPARIAELGVTVHLRRGGTTFQLPEGAVPELVVRNRRIGDRFGSKKLKDVFIDRKIAPGERDRVPLLVWNGEIVCIAGVAVARRFRLAGPAGERYDVWLEGSGAADE